MVTEFGSIADIRRKFHKTHESLSTSYHEAGHTVYGLLHFIKIEDVSIFENKKTKRIEGFTHYNSLDIETIIDPILFSDRLHIEISISYSGLIAEKILFKNISGSGVFPLFLKDGSQDDTSSAALLLRKYNLAPAGPKRYNYKQKLIRQVTKELQINWNAVEIVAHALFEKKKLSYLDLKQLLLRKSKNKKFWKKQFKIFDDIYDAERLDENAMKIILSL